MRPKMTDRRTAAGEPIFTYLCTTKERSRGQACAMKNGRGNELDDQVIAAIKGIGPNREKTAEDLAKLKRALREDADGGEHERILLRKRLEEAEAEMRPLLHALGTVGGTAAEGYLLKEIEALHQKRESLQVRLTELETSETQYGLTEAELGRMSGHYASWSAIIDDCTVEEKRAVIRSLIQKISWDGENLHIYLQFGEN